MKQRFYSALPRFYTERVDQESFYANIDSQESVVFNGFMTFFLLSVAASYFLPLPLIYSTPVGLLIGVVAGFGVPYMFISVRAERLKSSMESVLPDALRLISSNMRSGHTVQKAFMLSARDEFGILSDELKKTGMDIYGGESVEGALRSLEGRVKSELFQETLKLLIDGIESGGNKADLLESSAEDIRNSLELRKEIQSSIRMYMIFIVMVAVAGAPILFGVSVYMADTTTEMWEDSGMGEMDSSRISSQIGFNLEFQAPKVDVQMFRYFAFGALITTNTFAALIISEIRNGTVKQGVKYAPIFATASVLIFVGVSRAISAALSGFA